MKWPDLNFKTPDEYKEGNGDKCMYDDTIRFLQSKQLGFTGGCHLTSGKEYIKTIQTVLFTLQLHLHTLHRRKAPLFFSPLLEKEYNNPAAHHHKAPPLSQDRLDKLIKYLYMVLAFPVMGTSKWRECATATRQLAINLDEYCKHLKLHQNNNDLGTFLPVSYALLQMESLLTFLLLLVAQLGQHA